MNVKPLSVGTLLAVGIAAALQASSMAAAAHSCVPGKATPESYTWDFKAEASRLLDQVRVDAVQAHSHADKLKDFDMQPLVSWEAHAAQLTDIKQEINDMGRKLCRLEQIRSAVAPWQQQAIDRVAPQIRLMANSAEDAMYFLNSNQTNFWEPVNERYASNIYQDSGQVAQSVRNFEEYAKAHNEEMHLQKSLGVRAGS